MSANAEAGPAARTQRLIELLDDAGVDTLLVTDLISLRYLTGYSGSNGLALIAKDSRIFVTDFRYQEQVEDEVDPSFERLIRTQSILEAVPDLLPARGPLRLGYDDVTLSVRGAHALRAQLDERITLVESGGLVEALRRVKEPGEIELIAAAQRIADEGFETLIASGLKGRTERNLALMLEFEMRRLGAEAAAFDSIVGAGPNGALPHGHPSGTSVKDGDLVVIDWGARVAGYHSDCTRTVAVGHVSDEQREAYELVLRAQLAGLDAVTQGADCYAVDRLVRDIIDDAGYKENFGHGLGHGVGLEIHEAPTLSYRATPGADRLRTGEVATVEPGVYLPGKFGIRIEDLVVVTGGAPRILTGITKDLQIVD
jgi:Xaa-Pro aminopeptidase